MVARPLDVVWTKFQWLLTMQYSTACLPSASIFFQCQSDASDPAVHHPLRLLFPILSRRLALSPGSRLERESTIYVMPDSCCQKEYLFDKLYLYVWGGTLKLS